MIQITIATGDRPDQAIIIDVVTRKGCHEEETARHIALKLQKALDMVVNVQGFTISG